MRINFLTPLILQKIIWIPTRFLLVFLGHLKIEGLENLKGEPGPIIFACNHSSEIDPFMVPVSLPFWSHFSPIFYFTKEKEFYHGNGWRQHLFGGAFIRMWGGYTVFAGLQDYSKTLSRHISIIKAGGSFFIFPEGHITRDGLLQPGKGGIAYLAWRTRCPIVPVYIDGVYKMSMKDFFKGKRTITIHFGPLIKYEELSSQIPASKALGSNRYKKQAEYVMEKIGEQMRAETVA